MCVCLNFSFTLVQPFFSSSCSTEADDGVGSRHACSFPVNVSYTRNCVLAAGGPSDGARQWLRCIRGGAEPFSPSQRVASLPDGVWRSCTSGQEESVPSVLSCFSHVQLCDPMGCSLPGSSVHGILQARTLQWVAMRSSRGSPQPRD